MNDMRIGGMASGMDIDKMVSKLMKAERKPLQDMEQDRTWLTWQRDAYRDVNKKFMEFRSQLTDMKMSTSFRARTTSSTNSDLVTANASSAASQSSYNISEVTQLASAATKVNGSSVFSNPESVDTSKSLAALESEFADSSDIKWKQGSVKSETIEVTSADNKVSLDLQDGTKVKSEDMSVRVGNKYYTVTEKSAGDLKDGEVSVNTDTGELIFNDNIDKGSRIDVKYAADYQVDKMTTSAEGTTIQLSNQQVTDEDLKLTIGSTEYTANGTDIIDSNQNVVGSLDTEEGVITMKDDHAIEADTDVEVTYKYDYTNFKIGAHTEEGLKNEMFNIKAGESFDSMIGQVNQADNGVSMFYDDMSGQISLTRTQTGNFNDNGDGDEFKTSGLFVENQLGFDRNVTESGGQNAVFSLNGLQTDRTSNSFEVSGVTFNLKQTFSGENVRVNINNDTEAVFENVKGFVETYNKLIGKVQDRLQSERHRDYEPLTDKQREEMTEREQKLWEDKAKSGMLRNDSMLSGALNDMRRDFYTQVENNGIAPGYSQLSEIGITTTSNYLEGGKLEIDEAKLKSAIQDDPEAVESLFTTQGSSYSEEGILQRMTDSVNQVMDQITEKAGNALVSDAQYTMGNRLNDMDERISSFEERLTQVENRYWRQFTQMEKAMQQMNSQSKFLSQNLGGGA